MQTSTECGRRVETETETLCIKLVGRLESVPTGLRAAKRACSNQCEEEARRFFLAGLQLTEDARELRT